AAQSFVRGEKEGAVLLYRPAECPAKLIHHERWFAGVEISTGGEHLVSQKLIDVSMELVGARLGDDIHHGAGVATIFSIERVSQNAKFFDTVRVGLDGGKVGEEVVGIAPVHAEVIGAAPAAV